MLSLLLAGVFFSRVHSTGAGSGGGAAVDQRSTAPDLQRPPPCHGPGCKARARAALTGVCGGGWRGPDDAQTFVYSMMVSRPTCLRCASQHAANLTASGVGPTDVAAVCATLPARWNPLSDLAPLPKIHHAVPYCRQNPTGKFSGCVRNEMIGFNHYMDSEDPVQLDMARITRAVPLDAAFGVPGSLYEGCDYNSCFHNKTEVVEAVKIAAKSSASLGITYDPWSQFWSSDPSVLKASGTGKTTGTCYPPHCDPKVEGVAQMKELYFYKARLRNITQWLDETNRALGVDVKIDAVVFDMELFYGCSTAADCRGLTRKSDFFYNLTKQELGANVTIIQYNRGTVNEIKGLSHSVPLSHDAAGPAWTEWPGYTPESLTDGYGTSLYAIPEIENTRNDFRLTVANAQKHNVHAVHPWLAFGVGFQRTVKGGVGGNGDGTTTLNYDWNYEYVYDWVLGKELNDPWPWNASVGHPPGFAKAWAAKFAPWNYATRVCMWPHPLGGFSHAHEGGQRPLLQVAQGNTTHQVMHFVAYVLGAAGEQHLPPGQPPVNTA